MVQECIRIGRGAGGGVEEMVGAGFLGIAFKFQGVCGYVDVE